MQRQQPSVRSQRFPLPLLLAGLLVLFAIGIVVHSSQSAQGATPPPSRPSYLNSTPSYHGPLGMPAIHPRPSMASASGARFTESDVRQYLATYRPGFTVPGTATPTVTSVQFIAAKQASDQMQGESIGVPETTLVCLVQLSGTFHNTYVPLGAKVVTFTQGVMVFDAHTGNLLVSSVG